MLMFNTSLYTFWLSSCPWNVFCPHFSEAILFAELCEVLRYFKFQSLIRYIDANYSTLSRLPFHVLIVVMFKNLWFNVIQLTYFSYSLLFYTKCINKVSVGKLLPVFSSSCLLIFPALGTSTFGNFYLTLIYFVLNV